MKSFAGGRRLFFIAALALLLLPGIFYYVSLYHRAPSGSSTTLAAPQQSAARWEERYAPERPQFSPPETSVLADVPRSPLADSLGDSRSGNEAKVVFNLIEYYRREFKAVPAGEGNREIVNALRGANPGRLPILPGDHPRLSSSGELLDAWDKPFAFHQVSRDDMEVRSAGPDGEFFTEDDLVAGKK